MPHPACHRQLRRFWFPLSRGLGIGVTEASEAEARELAEATRAQYFPDTTIVGVTADVDVSTLDANHVVPNLGIPAFRGVWYPRLTL